MDCCFRFCIACSFEDQTELAWVLRVFTTTLSLNQSVYILFVEKENIKTQKTY